jgi:hypothetical protein
MFSFGLGVGCQRLTTIQAKTLVRALLSVTLAIQDLGFSETIRTFGLMVLQHDVASSRNVTIAYVIGFGLIMDRLTRMFRTVGT